MPSITPGKLFGGPGRSSQDRDVVEIIFFSVRGPISSFCPPPRKLLHGPSNTQGGFNKSPSSQRTRHCKQHNTYPTRSSIQKKKLIAFVANVFGSSFSSGFNAYELNFPCLFFSSTPHHRIFTSFAPWLRLYANRPYNQGSISLRLKSVTSVGFLKGLIQSSSLLPRQAKAQWLPSRRSVHLPPVFGAGSRGPLPICFAASTNFLGKKVDTAFFMSFLASPLLQYNLIVIFDHVFHFQCSTFVMCPVLVLLVNNSNPSQRGVCISNIIIKIRGAWSALAPDGDLSRDSNRSS